MPVRAYTASDYAGLQAGPWAFYYGYEFGESDSDAETEDTWGFEVKRDGVSVQRWSYREMTAYQGHPRDVFEPGDCLLFGIGLWLAGKDAL